MIGKLRLRRTGGSLAAAIAIHVVLVAALFQIVFRYPLGQLIGLTEPELNRERIQFIKVPPPQGTQHSEGGRAAEPVKGAAPAPLQAPVVVPVTVPVAHPSDSSRAHAAGGTGTGFGVSGSPLATGVVPRQPDPRVTLDPGLMHVPRSVAEDVDSIVNVAIGIVSDSIAIAAGQRKPGDWSFKGKGGTWGWDQTGIRLGKFTIPQALLALLPLNVSSPQSPIEARSTAYIHRDVIESGQRSISEDDFRAAVKRIRERKERERREREKMVAEEKQKAQTTP